MWPFDLFNKKKPKTVERPKPIKPSYKHPYTEECGSSRASNNDLGNIALISMINAQDSALSHSDAGVPDSPSHSDGGSSHSCGGGGD